MEKTKVRVAIDYVEVNGVFNNEIYIMTGGEWTNLCMVTCINCGDLFVFNMQNPKYAEFSIKKVVDGVKCPNCNIQLNESIEKYPQTFRTTNGILAHADSTNVYDELKTEMIDVWKIT